MQIHFVIYSLLLGIALLFGLVNLQKLTSPFRLLVLLIGYVFASELLARCLMWFGHKNTFPMYHLNAVVLIAITGTIYLTLFGGRSSIRRFVLILSVICGLTSILNSLFHQDIYTCPSFGIAAHALQSILLALLMFNEMIKAPTTTPLMRQSLFWFNGGTFLCYSSNFIGFVLYNEYYQVKGIPLTLIFYLNWIANLAMYSCYLTAIYLDRRRTDERSN